MRRRDVDLLDSKRTYWVPALVAPERDWAAAPGCRRGARFMVERHSLRPTREEFAAFGSRPACLRWIMRHRLELNRALPGASIRAVALDRWLLGLE